MLNDPIIEQSNYYRYLYTKYILFNTSLVPKTVLIILTLVLKLILYSEVLSILE